MLKMGVLGKLPLICIHEISLHIISGLSRFLIKDVWGSSNGLNFYFSMHFMNIFPKEAA